MVLGSCKVGNFVVSTPVLRVAGSVPDSVIGFLGDEVTADLKPRSRALIGVIVGMLLQPMLAWSCSNTLFSGGNATVPSLWR